MSADIIREFPEEDLPPGPRSLEQLGILVLDGSGSMSEPDAEGRGTKAEAVGQAVRGLTTRLKDSTRSQDFWLALIVFDNNVEVRLQPTALRHIEISSIATDPYMGGETAIGDALFAASTMAEDFIAAETDLPRSVVIMLMSDGKNITGRDPLTVAQEIKTRSSGKVNIVSVAYGKDADKETLLRIASDPEKGFRSTDRADELRSFFEQSIVQRESPR